jgi:hypothetical protein
MCSVTTRSYAVTGCPPCVVTSSVHRCGWSLAVKNRLQARASLDPALRHPSALLGSGQAMAGDQSRDYEAMPHPERLRQSSERRWHLEEHLEEAECLTGQGTAHLFAFLLSMGLSRLKEGRPLLDADFQLGKNMSKLPPSSMLCGLSLNINGYANRGRCHRPEPESPISMQIYRAS